MAGDHAEDPAKKSSSGYTKKKPKKVSQPPPPYEYFVYGPPGQPPFPDPTYPGGSPAGSGPSGAHPSMSYPPGGPVPKSMAPYNGSAKPAASPPQKKSTATPSPKRGPPPPGGFPKDGNYKDGKFDASHWPGGPPPPHPPPRVFGHPSPHAFQLDGQQVPPVPYWPGPLPIPPFPIPSTSGSHRGPASSDSMPPFWNRDSRIPPPLPGAGGPPQQRRKNGDGREGATSPSQIESTHRDEVQHMGCTCKKTRCLKLYCQCFGVKLYCGANCRCLQCYNTQNHEKERKEAMRAILLRNPGAFDTKFRKTGQPAAAEVAANSKGSSNGSTGTIPLAHKIGCKCRKSACLKKYCECYAGNVRCSSSCRCMGCKNMGTRFRRPPEPPSYAAPSSAIPYLQPGHPQMPRRPTNDRPEAEKQLPPRSSSGGQKNGEPWLAAQNLTFLKRGSPSSAEKKRKPEHPEIASMPSLASSSEGTSPGVEALANDSHREERKEADVNSLLMAAYAMTEFAGERTVATSPVAKKSRFASGASHANGYANGSSSSMSTPKR